jgi:hypothetical protein
MGFLRTFTATGFAIAGIFSLYVMFGPLGKAQKLRKNEMEIKGLLERTGGLPREGEPYKLENSTDTSKFSL